MLLPLQGAFSPDINPGRFPGLGASGLSARVNHTGRNHFSPFQPYSLKIISARVNRTAWKSFQPVSTIQVEIISARVNHTGRNHFNPCQPYSLKIISARFNHTGGNILQSYYYFLNIGSIPSLKMSKIGFIHFVLSAFCSNFASVFENSTYQNSR